MCNTIKSEIIVLIAKALYDKSIEHGIHHVERVYKWALRIRENEELDVNPLLLKLAVYLHDIGREIGEPHAYYSALIAEELLKEAECSEIELKQVVEAIKAHSFSYSKNNNVNPDVLGKILSDADKLDALGLIGFLRVFLYGEKHGRSLEVSLNHFYEKILKLHKLMHYNYSRKTAEKYTERTRFLIELLEREMNGE